MKNIDKAKTTQPSVFNEMLYLRAKKGALSLVQEKPNHIWTKVAIENGSYQGPLPYLFSGKVHNELTQAYNGKSGWQQRVEYDAATGNISRSEITDVVGAELEELKTGSVVSWSSSVSVFDQSSVEGLSQVDDKPCYVVATVEKNSDNLKMSVCFDVVSGRIVRMQKNDMTIFFDDYQMIDGIYMPHQLQFFQPDSDLWMMLKVTDWKSNESISPQIFNKPIK